MRISLILSLIVLSRISARGKDESVADDVIRDIMRNPRKANRLVTLPASAVELYLIYLMADFIEKQIFAKKMIGHGALFPPDASFAEDITMVYYFTLTTAADASRPNAITSFSKLLLDMSTDLSLRMMRAFNDEKNMAFFDQYSESEIVTLNDTFLKSIISSLGSPSEAGTFYDSQIVNSAGGKTLFLQSCADLHKIASEPVSKWALVVARDDLFIPSLRKIYQDVIAMAPGALASLSDPIGSSDPGKTSIVIKHLEWASQTRTVPVAQPTFLFPLFMTRTIANYYQDLIMVAQHWRKITDYRTVDGKRVPIGTRWIPPQEPSLDDDSDNDDSGAMIIKRIEDAAKEQLSSGKASEMIKATLRALAIHDASLFTPEQLKEIAGDKTIKPARRGKNSKEKADRKQMSVHKRMQETSEPSIPVDPVSDPSSDPSSDVDSEPASETGLTKPKTKK